MSYSFLVGAVIFVICWFAGWLRIDFAIDKLSKTDRERLLDEVRKRDIRFRFIYALIFLVVFAIFEFFPTIVFGIKFACAFGFFIFIVSTGFGTLMRIRRLSLPRDFLNSVLAGFVLIVVGYLNLAFLIRDTLAIRIWN